MALTDRKIPILTDINDTPSTTGQANHPNASLLCKQYNDLIDDLTPTVRPVIQSLSLYVDSVNGDDLNDGLTDLTAFATIERAIDESSKYVFSSTNKSYVDIRLAGSFTNPVIDISLIQGRGSNNLWWRTTLEFWFGTISGQTATIVLNNYSLFINGNSPVPLTLYFSGINFTTTTNIIFREVSPFLSFFNCTFTTTASTNFGSGVIGLFDTHAQFTGCTITASGVAQYSAISNTLCVIEINNCTYSNCTYLCYCFEGGQVLNLWTANVKLGGGVVAYKIWSAIAMIRKDSSTGVEKEDGAILTTTRPSISDAVTGTEIATINNILTTLRTIGFIN